MLAHLADVSVRSLLLALPAAIVLWLLRKRRTAALQHAVWTTVVCGMLALFSFGQALPRLPLRILDRPAATKPAVSRVSDADATGYAPFAGTIPPAPSHHGRPIDWKDAAFFAYGAVAFAFLAWFATGMFLVRKLASTGRPIAGAGMDAVYESDRVSVPVTVLWLRPRILLPPEWRQWDREKLDAVLAHEGAHVRRGDALVAVLAGVNRSLFWFHPLAWMLERKLALLADQACDESCVALLGDRDRYARLLLEMARAVDRTQGRLRRHALTMAAGSHIRLRIDAILEEGRTFSRGLSGTGWVAVILCGIPVLLGAGAVELDRRPQLLSIDMPRWTPPAPRLSSPRAAVQIAQAQTAPAQSALPPAPTPKFDRVNIKPCAQGDGAGRAGRGGGEGGRGIPVSPPGELFVNCLSVRSMLDISLNNGTDRLLNDSGTPNSPERIRQGPVWMSTDLYTIDAVSSDPVANVPGPTGNANFKLLSGPMLQALLEDRFQLKIHRETEEVPMFALTLADSRFKLQTMEEGACIPHEPGTPTLVTQMFPPGQKPLCVSWLHTDGPNWKIDTAGQSIGQLARTLGGVTDRYVLDKTGVTGVYSISLIFAHDKDAPGNFPPGFPDLFPPSDIPPAPSINTVLEQQLGLKLVPDKGPHEYIVVDGVERPSMN